MAVQFIDRFHPRLRQKQQAAIDAGYLYRLEQIELLDMQQIRPLALLSLVMFVGGALGFGVLNIAAYLWRGGASPFAGGLWAILLWLACNIASYVVILPLHELIHGLAFGFWGGRPHFGAKLPLALYCGARNQMFRRNHYVVIGLAPLVVITLAAVIGTLFFPVAASYVILASVGNFAGAAGDLWSVVRILRYPAHVCVEDTETGFTLWEVRPALPAGEPV